MLKMLADLNGDIFMNSIKKLTKSTIIYFFGTIGTKLVSFLLLPLYTSYIAPSSYGIYDLNISYATLFASFFFLDIWTGIMKFVFEKEEQKDKKKVVYNGICIFITSSVVYLAALSTFGVITKIDYLPGVLSYGFFLCLQSLYGYLARTFGYNTRFAVSGIISTFCTAFFNILLLVVFQIDYQALYISYALGILIQCIVLESRLNIIPSFKITYLDKNSLRELLKFSLPLCINSLCYWLLTGYNKIVITEQLGASANGYYAIASKFGGILIIVSSCFSMAWQETAYERFDKSEENGMFYSKATALYLKTLFIGFILLLPCISLVFPFLIDMEYQNARSLIPVNMLATMAGILFIFLANIISTYKRNGIIFLSTLIACIANILIIHIMIPFIGLEAANIALLSGYLISNLIRIIIIRHEIPYHVNGTFLWYMIPIILCSIWAFQKNNPFIDIFVLAASLLISIALLKPIVKNLLKTTK